MGYSTLTACSFGEGFLRRVVEAIESNALPASTGVIRESGGRRKIAPPTDRCASYDIELYADGNMMLMMS